MGKIFKNDKSKNIKVGPSESMSKSKKIQQTLKNIINNYGADAARLFILSDSPPEKDVQWSEEELSPPLNLSKKLWNLNLKIKEQINQNHESDTDDEINKYTNKFLKQITDNLESFSYNKIIANLHEVHTF